MVALRGPGGGLRQRLVVFAPIGHVKLAHPQARGRSHHQRLERRGNQTRIQQQAQSRRHPAQQLEHRVGNQPIVVVAIARITNQVNEDVAAAHDRGPAQQHAERHPYRDGHDRPHSGDAQQTVVVALYHLDNAWHLITSANALVDGRVQLGHGNDHAAEKANRRRQEPTKRRAEDGREDAPHEADHHEIAEAHHKGAGARLDAGGHVDVLLLWGRVDTPCGKASPLEAVAVGAKGADDRHQPRSAQNEKGLDPALVTGEKLPRTGPVAPAFGSHVASFPLEEPCNAKTIEAYPFGAAGVIGLPHQSRRLCTKLPRAY